MVKAKARLVAERFRQRPGVDSHAPFAPTLATPCIRLMAAIVRELRSNLCRFDVQQAFVQTELKDVVLMRMPQGCGALSGRAVCLNRSFYALEKASRSWHNHLVVHLKRCDRCCEDLNPLVPVSNLGELAMECWVSIFPRQDRGFIDDLREVFYG